MSDRDEWLKALGLDKNDGNPYHTDAPPKSYCKPKYQSLADPPEVERCVQYVEMTYRDTPNKMRRILIAEAIRMVYAAGFEAGRKRGPDQVESFPAIVNAGSSAPTHPGYVTTSEDADDYGEIVANQVERLPDDVDEIEELLRQRK